MASVVGSRTGAMLRRFSLAGSLRFRGECLNVRTVSWFPAPASSNPAGCFPALGFPACFVSRVMGPIPLSDFPSGSLSTHAVPIEDTELVMEPRGIHRFQPNPCRPRARIRCRRTFFSTHCLINEKHRLECPRAHPGRYASRLRPIRSCTAQTATQAESTSSVSTERSSAFSESPASS